MTTNDTITLSPTDEANDSTNGPATPEAPALSPVNHAEGPTLPPSPEGRVGQRRRTPTRASDGDDLPATCPREVELLAIILGCGSSRATAVLTAAGGLRGLASAREADLCTIGIRPERARFIRSYRLAVARPDGGVTGLKLRPFAERQKAMSDEIVRLRKVLARMQGGPGRRYSPDLRRQVRAAAARRRSEGAPWLLIAKEIGIPHETVRRFSSERVRGAFVPVEVAAPGTLSASMAVVSPNGYRVEGIGVAEAADLLRRLS